MNELSEGNIFLDKSRVKHIKKRHKKDSKTENDFWEHVESILEIVVNPDYVGLHPNGESLQFIKRIDELTLVAVKVEGDEVLSVRTMYPIKQNKNKWCIMYIR